MTTAPIVAFAAAVALVTMSSDASAQDGISFSKDGHTVYAAPHDAVQFTPRFVTKAKSATIFSNLASVYAKGVYFATAGAPVNSGQFVASAFTPSANVTVFEVQAATSVLKKGNSAYTLSIYSDNAGVPGTPLASAAGKSTQAFGSCCALVAAKLTGGLALTGGTPYWVAITLSAEQQNAGDEVVWNLSTTDQVDAAPIAYNQGSGWHASTTRLPPAFGVFSK